MLAVKGITSIQMTLNGERVQLQIRPSDTLLRALREYAGTTGPKAGCENGDCGACTVLLNDKPVKACMMLALEAANKTVTTVEGLMDTEIQEAFIKEGGFQCGYCTSGFVVNAFALLENKPFADEKEKKEWLSANLCRCTGYEGIRNAVDTAQIEVQRRLKSSFNK